MKLLKILRYVFLLLCFHIILIMCACNTNNIRSEKQDKEGRYIDCTPFQQYIITASEGIYISRPVPNLRFNNFNDFCNFLLLSDYAVLSEEEKAELFRMSQQYDNNIIPLPDTNELHYVNIPDSVIFKINWKGGERYTVYANVSLPTGSFTYHTTSYMLENETDLFINAKNDPLDSVTHIDTFTQDGIPYTIHRGLGYQYFEIAFWTYVSVHGTFYVQQQKYAETEEDLAVVPFESTYILWQSGETFYKITMEDSSQITVTTDYLDSFEIINTTAE